MNVMNEKIDERSVSWGAQPAPGVIKEKFHELKKFNSTFLFVKNEQKDIITVI